MTSVHLLSVSTQVILQYSAFLCEWMLSSKENPDRQQFKFLNFVTHKRYFHQSKNILSLFKHSELRFEVKFNWTNAFGFITRLKQKLLCSTREKLSRSTFSVPIAVTRYTVISDFSSITCLQSAEMHWNKASVLFRWLNLVTWPKLNRACREVLFPYELFRVFISLTTVVSTSVHHQRPPVNAFSKAVNLKVVQELWHNLQGKTKV